jgi:hypothetical protein
MGGALSSDEIYMRNTNAFLPDVRDKNQALLSPWAARQQYRILSPPPYVPPIRKTKPTETEIDLRRKAKAKLKLQMVSVTS